MLCLFDLDGTLIDSEHGIIACVKHALVQLQTPVPEHSILRSWIGPPLRTSFAPLLNHDPVRIEAAVHHYHERFHTDGWHEHTIYPGIEAAVRQLHAAGHSLAIVTSKPQRHAAPIVEALPFGHLFTRMYCPHPDSAHSEKASMIASALADFAASPAKTVMIGDRCFDIEGAVANNVTGIGVLWGFGSLAELQQAGATSIVATPNELAARLMDGDRL